MVAVLDPAGEHDGGGERIDLPRPRDPDAIFLVLPPVAEWLSGQFRAVGLREVAQRTRAGRVQAGAWRLTSWRPGDIRQHHRRQDHACVHEVGGAVGGSDNCDHRMKE